MSSNDGKLTDTIVHGIVGPGKFYDGTNGLYLRVAATGARQWVQRIAIRGKTRELGLGGYPVVTLREARVQALANRRLARAGGDPTETPWPVQVADLTELLSRGQLKTAPVPDEPDTNVPDTNVPTFAQAAETAIALKSSRWKNGGKSAAQWHASLRQYAFPTIGDVRVDKITTQEIVDLLHPIWSSKHETASRVKQRISVVMDWAKASGFRADNPATIADSLLPNIRRNAVHFPALPYRNVRDAVQKVLRSNASQSVRLAFGFLVLTACRSGEIRGATHHEIDWDQNIWTIPAARTKTNRVHRVPLSDGARYILDVSRGGLPGKGLLFPMRTGRPMSDSTLSKLTRSLGIASVPHGFRSSFRDWAAAEAQAPREVAEISLGHETYSRVEAAYARSDLLERRRELMQEWCDYLQLNRPDEALR